MRDEHGGFADFPLPLRPVYDLLAELKLVTEFPTLLAVDGWNRCATPTSQTSRPAAWPTPRRDQPEISPRSAHDESMMGPRQARCPRPAGEGLRLHGFVRRWDQMATSTHWQTKTPLHASNLLVPSLLDDVTK